MKLSEEGKREFLNSNFHPYFDIELTANINEESVEQFVNFVLPISVIDETYSITEDMRSFFNNDFTNILFTSTDEKNIYHYECYQNVYFIRIRPFQSTIRMHILPKKYDASDTNTNTAILIFRDNKQTIDANNFTCTPEYERHSDTVNVNLYYTDNEQKTSHGLYKFNIKDSAKNFKNLQINAGYSYNNTNPTYNADNSSMETHHYLGILDESDQDGISISPEEFTEYNEALMDANYDNISTFTNNTAQQQLTNNTIQCPQTATPYSDSENEPIGFDNEHDIDTIYHKTVKYFNGDIYTEENGLYIFQKWIETR